MTSIKPRENLATLFEGVRTKSIAARSSATRRAYSYDWTTFVTWAESHRRAALPASQKTVAAYIVQLDKNGLSNATIARTLASISTAHKLGGLATPTTSALVRDTFRGIKREKTFHRRKASPITLDHLGRLLEYCDNTSIGLRDRALVLVGWAAALRRSEIVLLDVGDIEEHPEGIAVVIRRSKTDQEQDGVKIGLPFADGPLCPVRALRAWLAHAEISEGPIFRSIYKGGKIAPRRLSDQRVNAIVKRLAAAAGYNPDSYSGHSLRSGFATSAAKVGCEERDIMRHTRHRSIATAREYIREGSLFENPLSTLLK